MERLLRSRVLLRLLNVGIQGGTVLGRFALIMFLAKFLPKAELGKFGVFVATVLICVLVASFDLNICTESISRMTWMCVRKY